MKKPNKTQSPVVSNPADSRELSADQLAEANGGGGFDLTASYGFSLWSSGVGTVSLPGGNPPFDLGGGSGLTLTFPKG